MMRALSQYARDEVLVRAVGVVWGTEVLISGSIGVGIGIWGPGWGFATLKPADISATLLTYAAIAFGFCISGLALVLTLPNREFVTWLIEEKGPKTKVTSGYSDLLFVFSWTAICHWVLVVIAFLALIIRNTNATFLNWHDGTAWKVFVGCLFGVTSYSFIQFLLTVITLSQVGRLYINKIQRDLHHNDQRS